MQKNRTRSLTAACTLGLLALGALAARPAAAQSTDARYPIVPAPRSLQPRAGAFVLDRDTRILLDAGAPAEVRGIAEFLAGPLRSAAGIPLPVGTPPGAAITGGIVMRLQPTGDSTAENYHLTVSPRGILLSAPTPRGLFWGVQTLRQLLPADMEDGRSTLTTWSVPAVEIDDAPRFSYRGLHLDVGRHFFPAEFVKHYIDLLALYKFNTFHWHLTEDQGWRIEIRKYPRLTEVGSCRKETMLARNFNPYVGDRIPYCGFYTQDEIRDVVAYAAARQITVIPEIEMPGHSVAAIAAYPELGCGPGPYEVRTTWGVSDDILCPSEKTFTFLEDVLTEVMALFPSRYIHIGGDEAPKKAWEQSALAQAVIEREGLKDEHELQSYFIQRMEKFLNAHGREIIGWDEILEGGLAPNATVMSWRGTAGGIAAAKQHHDVVMTPTDYLYLDYYQADPKQEPLGIGGFVPLEKVYSFEPVPAELTAEEAKYILGAQGNIWTEYVASGDHVEYMVFPRALALSEVDWSPKSARDWDSFLRRLPAQLRRLDELGVTYRIPDVTGLERDRLVLDETVRVQLGVPADAVIRYTTDGSDPTAASPRYTGPFTIRPTGAGVTVKARAYLPNGRSGAMRQATFTRTSLLPATQAPAAQLQPGLGFAYAEGAFATAEAVRAAQPARSGTAAAVGLQGGEEGSFGLRFTGLLRVPRDGVYAFHLTSKDAAQLRIDDRTVVDHGGRHGRSEKLGEIALRAGWHPIEVLYAQQGRNPALELAVTPPDGARQPLPAEWLAHR